MDVLVNHLGYERGAPKRAVLKHDEEVDLDSFALIDAESSDRVREGTPSFEGHLPDWRDWVFWSLDFSDVSDPGRYYLRIEGEEIAHSRAFEIRDNLTQEEVLSDVLYYFKAMRCSGRYDRADHDVTFVGDREDEVDVHGGWYDACGDMSKYLSHLSYANYMNPQQTPLVVWGLADAYERLLSYDHDMGENLEERLVEETLHGADFLVRMQDDASYFYMTVFDQWSKDVDRREICAYETEEGHKTEDYEAGYRQGGGIAIAALARASGIEGPSDYDAETYRMAAIEGFDHLEAHNEEYLDNGVENVIDDYCALLAATELHEATDEERFADAARERVRALLDRQTGDENYEGWWRADEEGERPYFHAAEEGFPVVALLRYLEVVPDSALRGEIEEAVTDYWAFEREITTEVVNPFGYARQYVKAVDEDDPRSAFFLPHENETGYWWQGENARLGSLAAAAYRTRAMLDDAPEGLDAFARDQLNWILGLNPFDVCMVRGIGRDGPNYHKAFRNAPGGIMNGITAGYEDESDIAFCPEPIGDDHAHRWRWLEQWIPHAAWFFVAASSTERA